MPEEKPADDVETFLADQKSLLPVEVRWTSRN